jgi:hypothetical protein
MRIRDWVLVLCGCLLLIWPNAVLGQTSARGEVHGVVTDESGSVIPGVQVTLTNLATGISRKTTTGTEGLYVFPLVDPGFYRLTVEKGGFATAVVSSLQVITTSPTPIDVAMKVGAVNQQITVTAAHELLNTRDATVSSLVSSANLEETPLNAKQYVNLIRLEPGVVPGTITTGSSFGRDFGDGGYVDGKRLFDSTSTVDGGAFWDPWVPSETTSTLLAGPGVSEDSIAEFKVIGQNPPPSVGFVYGSHVEVTTKSGTNELHGTAYDYLRNDLVDARSFFSPTKTPLKRNLFGASIGGPFRKDRTFFFGSYEGMRQARRDPRVPVVPTPALLAAVPGGAANGFLREILGAAFPAPVPGTFGPTDFTVPVPTTADLGIHYDAFLVRVDHYIGDKDALTFRYFFDQGFGALGSVFSTGVPTTDNGSKNRWQQQVISWTRNFSPKTINEFRITYTRQNNNFPTRDTPDALVALGFAKSFTNPRAMPVMVFVGTGLSPIGAFPGAPQFRFINFWQYNDVLSRIVRAHSLKFGADVQTQAVNDFFPQDIRPFYIFVGFGPPFDNSANGLTTGRFASVSNTFPTNPPTLIRGMRRRQFALFAEDTWQLSQRLTLDLGVRYELATPISESQSLMNNLYQLGTSGGPLADTAVSDINRTALVQVGSCHSCLRLHHEDKLDFAPRIGLAWVPFANRKTVFRGGFAIQYGEMFMNITAFNRTNPPFSRGVTLFNQPFATNIFSGPSIIPPLFTYDPAMTRPYYAEWNFGVQQQLDANTTFQVSYIANRGKRLLRPFTPNFGAAFSGTRPNPNFGRIVQWRSAAQSWYDSLQVIVRRRLAAGLMFQTSYTWSKSLDEASGEIFAFSDDNFLSDPANPAADKGPSDYDLTHMFVANFVYELPIGRGKRFLNVQNSFANTLLGGWSTSGIFTYLSGQRVTFFSGRDNNGDGNLNDRARVIGDLSILRNTSGLDKTQFFNPAAVGTALSATQGTVIIGRNTGRAPSFVNTDFSVAKRFRLSERFNLDFRSEFFNLLNHTNLEQPDSNVSSPTFGRIFATRNLGREMQFSLKLFY